ncbi:hypothetical protein GE09DRAFT_1080813 [Coniochaeta sp. 2T2.1]|nr:hypothetical protein GE09DRAFT_1080813 [Coniochaeta sp. 2T2.1]
MTTMAALEPLKRGSQPSLPPVSETNTASGVETPETLDQADGFQQPTTSSSTSPSSVSGTKQHQASPLPNSRNVRSKSLAIRRKPLSSTASPLVTKFTSRDYLEIGLPTGKPETRFSRSYSVDSPTLYEFPQDARPPISASGSLACPATTIVPSQLSSPVFQDTSRLDFLATVGGEAQSRNIPSDHPAAAQTTQLRSQHEVVTKELCQPTTTEEEVTSVEDEEEAVTSFSPRSSQFFNINTNAMSLAVRKAAPPHLSLGQVDTGVRATPHYLETPDKADSRNKPLPKSPPPSSKLGTFFTWDRSPTSPSTVFSDKDGISPIPSPYSSKPTTDYNYNAADDSSAQPTLRDSTDANEADESPLDYCEAYLQTPSLPSHTPPTSFEVEEMEDELKAISAELASSIRREMDLEDLVDRLQDQVNNAQAPGRRTSDYYSDSGYSSAKFSEYDHGKEEISQVQRRAEQEKAQITLELTQKLQDERDRRKKLDQQILELSQKASQVDLARSNSQDASSRIRELESTCEDLRRKLADERQAKNNFEDLLSVLKGELNTASNERDNLRDEVVPQLRARVEGLEAQAADNAKNTYDTTKIQQELQTLKEENSQLKQQDSRRNQEVETLMNEASDMRALGSRKSMEIRTLRDDFSDPRHSATTRDSIGLSRSASVTAGSRKSRPPAMSLSRSNTTKHLESRDAIAERLKDVEAQRDALHSALKSLLERQEHQNRENGKRIRALEAERDRLLTASPQKSGYEREVSILRDEINVLRRRAEEAVEQKWQVEKGLSGLKMDLDRAESEIAQLRSLLQENDILIPEAYARSSASSYGSNNSIAAAPVTSASLEKAYKDLQAAYTDALRRIKSLESAASTDDKTMLAMQRLEQSLAAAISERDHAQHEADSYRKRIDSLQTSEQSHLASEKDLADQLRESARRVEELAQQVRTQLATNSSLRNRLADAVSRGEAEHRANKDRITSMQARLRTLEEQLVAAQTASEERVARHEDDIAALKEAQAAQLQRLRDNPTALRSPRPMLSAPKTPLTPSFAFNPGPPGSPRFLTVSNSRPGTSGSASSPTRPSRLSLRRTSTAPADTGDAAEIETLRTKVRELETALSTAEGEMQEVVARMSEAQIEVMNLQEERETAVRKTRRVQKLLEEERISVFEGKFRSITTDVR